jgi:hypothetical protein
LLYGFEHGGSLSFRNGMVGLNFEAPSA